MDPTHSTLAPSLQVKCEHVFDARREGGFKVADICVYGLSLLAAHSPEHCIAHLQRGRFKSKVPSPEATTKMLQSHLLQEDHERITRARATVLTDRRDFIELSNLSKSHFLALSLLSKSDLATIARSSSWMRRYMIRSGILNRSNHCVAVAISWKLHTMTRHPR